MRHLNVNNGNINMKIIKFIQVAIILSLIVCHVAFAGITSQQRNQPPAMHSNIAQYLYNTPAYQMLSRLQVDIDYGINEINTIEGIKLILKEAEDRNLSAADIETKFKNESVPSFV